MSIATKKLSDETGAFDDETEPEAVVEGEPTQLLRRLREERRLSDAAFDAASRTARAITAGLARPGSSGRLRPVKV